MKTSGFTLCDDLMEMVGERVKAKREQDTMDTMDYWCERPSPYDERCTPGYGKSIRAKRRMLDTLDYEIYEIKTTVRMDTRDIDIGAQTMMTPLKDYVSFGLSRYVRQHLYDEKKLRAFDDPKFWARQSEVVPAFVKGYPVSNVDFHSECVLFETRFRHELEAEVDALPAAARRMWRCRNERREAKDVEEAEAEEAEDVAEKAEVDSLRLLVGAEEAEKVLADWREHADDCACTSCSLWYAIIPWSP